MCCIASEESIGFLDSFRYSIINKDYTYENRVLFLYTWVDEVQRILAPQSNMPIRIVLVNTNHHLKGFAQTSRNQGPLQNL